MDKMKFRLLATLVLGALAAATQAQQPGSQAPGAGPAGGPPQSVPPDLVAGPPPGPRRAVRAAPGPSMEAALAMARAIVESCKDFHVGVSVLDSSGLPKLMYLPDGTPGFHAFMSYRKANTALKFAMPSGKVADAIKADPALDAKYKAGSASFITFAGGLPLMAGTKLIGSVGVSGAEPSAKDEACALDGIKAAQSLLK